MCLRTGALFFAYTTQILGSGSVEMIGCKMEDILKVYLPIFISAFALLISFATLWLSRMRRGIIKMTRPSVIFLGRDGGGSKAAKVFLRTLVYNTADKGQYIQSMYVKLTRADKVTTFNIWTYGATGKLQ